MQPAMPIFVGEMTADGNGQLNLPAGGVRELGWAPGDELQAQVIADDVLLVLRRRKAPRTGLPAAPGVVAPPTSTNRSAHAGPAHPPMIAGAADPASEPPSVQTADGVVAGPDNATKQSLDDPPVTDLAASAMAQLEGLERRIAALERLLTRIEAAERAGDASTAAASAGVAVGEPRTEEANAEPSMDMSECTTGTTAESTKSVLAGTEMGTAAAGQGDAGGSGATGGERMDAEAATKLEAPHARTGNGPETSEEPGEQPAGSETSEDESTKEPGLHVPEDDDAPAELVLRLPKAKQFMRELARDIMQQMLPDHTTIRWK